MLEDGVLTLAACVSFVRAEEGENDGGVLSMRGPAREEALFRLNKSLRLLSRSGTFQFV